MWTSLCHKDTILVIGNDESVIWYDIASGSQMMKFSLLQTIGGMYFAEADVMAVLDASKVYIFKFSEHDIPSLQRIRILGNEHSMPVNARFMYKDIGGDASHMLTVVTDKGRCGVSLREPHNTPIPCHNFSRVVETSVQTAEINEDKMIIKTYGDLMDEATTRCIQLCPMEILLGLPRNPSTFLLQCSVTGRVKIIDVGPAPSTGYRLVIDFPGERISALTPDKMYLVNDSTGRFRVYDLNQGAMLHVDGAENQTGIFAGPNDDGTQILALTVRPAVLTLLPAHILYPAAAPAEVDTNELFGDIKNAAKTS